MLKDAIKKTKETLNTLTQAWDNVTGVDFQHSAEEPKVEEPKVDNSDKQETVTVNADDFNKMMKQQAEIHDALFSDQPTEEVPKADMKELEPSSDLLNRIEALENQKKEDAKKIQQYEDTVKDLEKQAKDPLRFTPQVDDTPKDSPKGRFHNPNVENTGYVPDSTHYSAFSNAFKNIQAREANKNN